MPASDQTRYPIARLHRIFAVASLALLSATIWMLVADHRRPWKQYQRSANEIELRMARLRKRQFETDEAVRQREQLQEQLQAVRQRGLDLDLVAQFQAEVLAESKRREAVVDMRDLSATAQRLDTALSQQAGEEILAARQAVLESVRQLVAQAEFAESRQFDLRKSTTADLDVAKANVNLAVRTGRTRGERDQLQATADALRETLQVAAAEHEIRKSHRVRLEEILNRLTQDEREIEDDLASNRTELDRLEDTLIARRSTWFEFQYGLPKPGKKMLELPILDAFNSPLRVHNLWAEGLTQDYHFREVPRFDRCTTCHTAIDRNLSATATSPEYPPQRTMDFTLQLGDNSRTGSSGQRTLPDLQILDVIGIQLTEGGLLSDDDVTVVYVQPGSPAARAKLTTEAGPLLSAQQVYRRLMWPTDDASAATALQGLWTGDTLVAIDGQAVSGQRAAMEQLASPATEAVDGADDVNSVVLTIRRGVPQPHTSHPRLDLFVGESSPHKMSEFACTVCHDGQGSATDFAWASHSPNSESERKRWRDEHQWFDNPHWGYPMAPRRFAESACLKCHHRVVDLLPSDRFPDPPAPKLIRGYQLILAYGCFGCHEINGFQNGRSIGPNLLLEPAIQTEGSEIAPASAGHLSQHWRSDLPGSGLRRPGPSLRGVGQKLSPAFMIQWIRDPREFSPSTRMPRAFGLWDHLDGTSRQLAEQYEPLEISGIVAYLQASSVSVPPLSPPSAVTTSEPAERIARGRELFQTRGCLACHNHKEFPDAAALRDKDQIVAGPDLSAVAEKLLGEAGRQWLVGFIREPTRYDPRTIMPNLSLDPLVQQGEVAVTTDPADDITEFLLASSAMGYSDSPASEPSDVILDRLVLEYLSDAYHVSKAEEFVLHGIPLEMADVVRDAERQLLVPDETVAAANFRLSTEQKLRYVGHKSIAKYGCFGCHDIAGFETAKPIGPALTEWGRIDPHRLAFENIAQYLDGHGASDSGESDGDSAGSPGRAASDDNAQSAYYMRQIVAGKRSGFAYQKLTEPRSYDYRVVDNKRYNERLRMHQFSFNDQDREAIVTFVLGLVAQPPRDKYVYTPDRKHAAILDGQVVLDRYQCDSCHMLKPERWQVSCPPGTFRDPNDQPTYPFVPHQFTTTQLETSRQPDRGGLLEATLSGLPKLGVDGGPMVFDDYGDELFDDEQYDPRTLEYAFQLWEPVALQGHAYQVGGAAISIWGNQIAGKRPSKGGYLAKYLLPHVVQIERRANPNAVGSQAWAWLPPPLLGEGRKVRPDWLHSYLLEPYAIRPASFMRMPKYNMSADEAAALVDYFAARDHVDFPYDFVDRRSPGYLAQAELAYRQQGNELTDATSSQDHSRLGDALQIVSDKNFCVTCHIVGDFQPVVSDRAKGPDLARVYGRLRADYVRRWVAQPASVLPYTPMQVIIPYQGDQDTLGGVAQSLYHGTSVQQLDAVVDLLMNFDVYARGQSGLVAPTDHGPDKSPPTEAR